MVQPGIPVRHMDTVLYSDAPKHRVWMITGQHCGHCGSPNLLVEFYRYGTAEGLCHTCGHTVPVPRTFSTPIWEMLHYDKRIGRPALRDRRLP